MVRLIIFILSFAQVICYLAPVMIARDLPQAEIKLHLGAHKTASTWLQATLTEQNHYLAENGIAFIGPRQLRDMTKSANFTAFFQTHIDPSAQHVILSDENLLGAPRGTVESATLYPEAQHNLTRLRGWLGVEPREIYLSIRDYADFFPSIIGQFLASHPRVEADFDGMRDLFRQSETSWITVIETVLAVFPNSKLFLWRYRDLHQIAPELMHHMLGAAGHNIRIDLERITMPSLTVEAQELLRRGVELGLDGNAFRRFLRNNPLPEGQRFFTVFWQPGDAEHWRQRYNADLDHIRARFGDKIRLFF